MSVQPVFNLGIVVVVSVYLDCEVNESNPASLLLEASRVCLLVSNLIT